MYYIITILLCLSLLLLLYSSFLRYESKRIFLGNKFSEGRFMSFILNKLSPPKNSAKYRNISNMMFILDNRRSVRDFLVFKLAVVVVGSVLAISIVVTNIVTRYVHSFEISSAVPIEISKEEYEVLTDSLTFESSNLQEELATLKSNISMLPDKDSVLKFKKVSLSNLYTYVDNVNNRLSDVFSLWDLLILVVVIFVSFKLPRLLLNTVFKILANNEFFEFDGLQTDILFLYDKSVQEILPVLCNNAMYHRNALICLKDMYERDPENMYSMVESRQEFHRHLKMLMRYLNMLENNGPEYLINSIMTSKKQTEEEVYATRVAASKKHVKHLNFICVLSFALAIVRLLLMILKSFF